MYWMAPMMFISIALPYGTINELASSSLMRASRMGIFSVWKFLLSHWTIRKSMFIKLYQVNQSVVCGSNCEFHLGQVPSNYPSYYYHHGRIFQEVDYGHPVDRETLPVKLDPKSGWILSRGGKLVLTSFLVRDPMRSEGKVQSESVYLSSFMVHQKSVYEICPPYRLKLPIFWSKVFWTTGLPQG